MSEVSERPMTKERTTITVELCPVCDRSNVAGHKWCLGRPGEPHPKSRFEWVQVVRASVLEGYDGALKNRDEIGRALQKELQRVTAEAGSLRSQLAEAVKALG